MSSSEFSQITGYPTWANLIPNLRDQTIIMAYMSHLAYQTEFLLTSSKTNNDNKITELGTVLYFTKGGEFVGADETKRFDISVPSNFDPTIITGVGITSDQILFPAGSTKGFYKPFKTNPTPYDPNSLDNIALAFHCTFNNRKQSNIPTEPLSFFMFQTLEVKTNPQTGEIVGLEMLKEVDEQNITHFFQSPVIAFTGSQVLQDYTTEFTPPSFIVDSIKDAIPGDLANRFNIFYANLATQAVKQISADTTLTYLLSPIRPGEDFQDERVPAVQPGLITLTGHSYGAALANMVSEFLVRNYIPRTQAQFQPTIFMDVYGFAPPPFLKSDAAFTNEFLHDAKGNPLYFTDQNGQLTDQKASVADFVFSRNFINKDDAVCSLKVPNFSKEKPVFVMPTQPQSVYHLYRIGDKDLETIFKYDKEYGGIPAELAFNLYHSLNKPKNSYIANLRLIPRERYAEIINTPSAGKVYDQNNSYKLTRLGAIKALAIDTPVNFLTTDPRQTIFKPNAYTKGKIPFTNFNLPDCGITNLFNCVDSLL